MPYIVPCACAHYFRCFFLLLFMFETGTKPTNWISGTNFDSFCIAFSIFRARVNGLNRLNAQHWVSIFQVRPKPRKYNFIANFSRLFTNWMFRLFFSMHEANSARAFKRLNTVKFAVVNLISAAHLGNRFEHDYSHDPLHRIAFHCMCYCLWHQLVAHTPIRAELLLSAHTKSIWKWNASWHLPNTLQ